MTNSFAKLPPAAFATDYPTICQQLKQINPLQYAKTRNFIDGSITYLSPYISRGVITTTQVLEAVLQSGYKPQESENFFQELAWREYFQRVWQQKADCIWQDLKQPQPDVNHHQMLTALQLATTGIANIDEQIKNLFATGYMHNHIRMYVASITCNIAKAHWLLPSKWMYYYLLDGDIASNNCSWQWVAGASASKKYYCNQENINRYTYGQQHNTFLDKPYEALPNMPIPNALIPTCTLQLQTALPSTLLPVIDCTIPTLIYNSYNLDPLWRKHEKANRILLLEPSHFSKFPVSKRVLDFILNLAKNIAGVQLYCGEIADLQNLYKESTLSINEAFVAKEHPAFWYYPGNKDSREWMFPQVTEAGSSFFNFWKKCERSVK